jgi:hypothetical protein
MKTYVLLPLWLLLTLSLQAQNPTATSEGRPQPCRPCCQSPDEPGLRLILAPELASQCQSCVLVSVAQCPLTVADIAAQRAILRYTIRDPEGVTSTHLTPMTMPPPSTGSGQAPGWGLQLYPPGDPAPECQPDAL